MPITTEEFRRLFDSFQQSAFRLQLLSEYRVQSEQEEYAKFLSGEPLPERAGNPWLETMAAQVANGRQWTNVHLLPERLTPYLRYLIDWWYVFQAQHGAKILFLPPQYTSETKALAPHDFWLFDDRILIRMLYGPDGQFLGVEDASSSPEALSHARQARDFALSRSEDLRTILARRRAGILI